MAVTAGQALGARLSGAEAQSFGAISSSSSRYDSGSHVDVKGTSLIAGVAKRTGFGLLGGFVEAGQGGFNSYNSFGNAPSVTGDGSTRYAGAGVLGRYDLSERFYLDGALRAGRTRVDFSSQNLCTGLGQCADYDSSVMYYGASLGAGYLHQLTEKTAVDVSSRVQLTHQNGTSLTIIDDPYTFAAINSYRWRNGVQINHALRDNLATYGGLAYEYEFDGKADGTAYGLPLDAPSVKGGTGILEVGIRSARKMDSGKLNLDAGLQGYGGKRTGFGGQLRLNYVY